MWLEITKSREIEVRSEGQKKRPGEVIIRDLDLF